MTQSVIRYDSSSMDQQDAYITAEGYIRAKAIVTRAGVFKYANADGTERRELRLPDEVFHSDALSSICLIPVTNGHPSEKLVTAENCKRLAVGFTGEMVEENGEYVLANFVITDAAAVKMVQENGRRELSLGYTVDLVPETGRYDGEDYDYKQTNIRYNHLALVDQARAGSMARIHLDGEDAIQINGEFSMAKRKIKIDNTEYLVEPAVAEIVERSQERGSEGEVDHIEDNIHNLEQELERVRRELEEQREELVRARRERDEASAERDSMREQGMDGKTLKIDSAEFHKAVSQRVHLFKTASLFLDNASLQRLDGAIDIDIKKAVIASAKKHVSLDGKSGVYIDTMYDLIVADAHTKPVLTNVQNGIKSDEKEEFDPESARQAMIKRDQNLLKKPKS